MSVLGEALSPKAAGGTGSRFGHVVIILTGVSALTASLLTVV
jgi:hypothetical protein